MNFIKKILAGSLMLCVLASCQLSSAAEYRPGDVIIVMKKPEAGTARLSSFAASSGAAVISTYDTLSEQSDSVFALLHSDSKPAEELARELLKDPDVIAASPNYIARISRTPNDPSYNRLWGLEYINAPEAWDTTTGSESIYVAVADTGVDWANPDLADNVATDLARNFVSSASSAFDDNGHGTHIAGIVGARGNNNIAITGVNWQVRIIPVKIMDSQGKGYLSDIIKGIEYVIYLVKQGYNVAAINLSLEIYEKAAPTHDNLIKYPLWVAMKQLDNLNSTVIVVAAGNYNATVGEPTTKTAYDSNGSKIYGPDEYVYPASFRGLNNMMSVAALDSYGNLAAYSNTNATINAPGVDILSTYRQSSSTKGTSLATLSGTSMAAPHVAGSVAILAAAKSGRTAFQYKCALLGVRGDSASNPESSINPDVDLDLAGALAYQANNTINRRGTQWDVEFSNETDTNTDNEPEAYDTEDPEDETKNNGNTNTTPNKSSGGGGGGCDSFSMGFAGLMMLCPVILRSGRARSRKKKS